MPKATNSFYTQVYAVVRQIPEGRVFTYGRVATVLGSPRAARAVGYALGHLPEGSDVPWQRVINAKGQIPLKGRGENADRQRRLLEGEGVEFDGEDRVDLKAYLWEGPEELPRWDGDEDPHKWL